MRAAVYLIGAGPGAPDLITLRGFRCLQAADVVIYDHMVDARLLDAAPEAAERIDVGGTAPQPIDQEAIWYLLAEKAREGKVVARLKWSDPFVFGYGGEEALFLHEQGIPFEVIPGVTTAVGAAAYAGIPITYPGSGDTVTFVRGHEDEGRGKTRVDWESLARLEGAIVCYAGPLQIPKMLEALVAHGRAPEEAAAIVVDGTRPSQRTIVATLGDLAHTAGDLNINGPALLIVGKVVGLREHLRWFDARPLFGRRVLVTRSSDQAGDLVDLLESHGAEAIQAPLIRIAPPEDPAALVRACDHVGGYEWIVFDSPNGVRAFFDRLLRGGRDLRALGGLKICAVGPGTAARLARLGVAVDVLPDDHRPGGVVRALAVEGPLEGMRVLLPRADVAHDVLADTLRHAGASVDEVVAYRTVIVESDAHLGIYRELLDRRIDAVTFTSASAIRAFASTYGADQAADLLAHTVVATIGPSTADAAARAQITPAIHLAGGPMAAFVDAIAAHFKGA